MDSSIEPDHLRCNSVLHWRKTGHFYCQDTYTHTKKNKWRWKEERQREWKRGISKNKEALARTKRGEDSSQWNCETIRYRFCHGCVTLTASCSPLCLSHVGWLLMEPSYPSWTSVMKFYSSYWIWWRDLCLSLSLPLSHSCSLVFIAQPQPSCMGHIHRHTQYRVLFGVQHIGIILPFTTVSCCLPSLDLSVNSAF